MENHTLNMRRKVLQAAVAGLLWEVGFEAAEKQALETLTEMMQSFICELGASSRSFCELSGRTEPVIGDVIVALVNMGVSVSGIEAHAKRSGRTVLPQPAQSSQPKQLNILQAGVKQPHPPHIFAFLPPFPDPHAYIRTPTHKQPVTEYEAIREKSASQKRDVERALTRFIAKTSDTHSLFLTEDNIFPLIACKPQMPPYLKALLPLDQVFDFEDEFASTPPRAQSANSSSGSRTKSGRGEGEREEDEDNAEGGEGKTSESGDAGKECEPIDNPYLRPVKLPRKRKQGKLPI